MVRLASSTVEFDQGISVVKRSVRAGAPTAGLDETLGGLTDAERAQRNHEATGRVIEYLQAQPVLRAGGRTVERFRLFDDGLREV